MGVFPFFDLFSCRSPQSLLSRFGPLSLFLICCLVVFKTQPSAIVVRFLCFSPIVWSLVRCRRSPSWLFFFACLCCAAAPNPSVLPFNSFSKVQTCPRIGLSPFWLARVFNRIRVETLDRTPGLHDFCPFFLCPHPDCC